MGLCIHGWHRFGIDSFSSVALIQGHHDCTIKGMSYYERLQKLKLTLTASLMKYNIRIDIFERDENHESTLGNIGLRTPLMYLWHIQYVCGNQGLQGKKQRTNRNLFKSE